MKKWGSFLGFMTWGFLAAFCFSIEHVRPGLFPLASGHSAFQILGTIAGVLAAFSLMTFFMTQILILQNKPAVEGRMIGRVLTLVSWFIIIMIVTYGLGKLASFGTLFSLFGGMIIGWSLQAPVSGFAAWILVCIKRPYRPGDRIQFPKLDITGDLLEVGAMYTVLDQVGGTIGSEEAVGRTILVPNAMLFNEVVINYTVGQERAYMLDEVVVRITYDSKWENAERVLLNAAREITGDIMEETGVEPYIRSDLYDYGVYMQLRYETRVNDRAEIAYKIQRRIFDEIQKDPTVDIAIPFIYSYRAGRDMKVEDTSGGRPSQYIEDVPISSIKAIPLQTEIQAIEQLTKSIAIHGLIEPIIIMKIPQPSDGKFYEILAGNMRFEACKRLGWKTVPAIVKPSRGGRGGD